MKASIVRWSAAVPIVAGLVLFERRILAVDRGLETTDEAFYLLAAAVTDRETVWGISAFQWHTRPMLLLAGYDIAWFRTLGAVLLLVSAFALAVGLNSTAPERVGAVSRGALLIALPVASHLYYATMLRSPSYNLVNLAGLMLAAGGTAFIAAEPRPVRSWSWSSSRGVILIAFGLVLAAPAKPSTPFLGLGIVLATLLAIRGAAVAVRVVMRASGIMLVLVLLLMAAGTWSRTPWVVLLRGLRAPALEPEQTIQGAIADAVTLPLQAIQMILGLPAWRVLGPIFVGVILALASHGALRRATVLILPPLGFSAFAAFRTAPVPPPWRGYVSDAFYPGWASVPLMDALVLVMLTGVTAATLTALLRRGFQVGESASDLRNDGVIAVSLLMWAALFGFGSGNGAYGMLSHAGVFLIAATLILFRHVEHRVGRVAAACVSVWTIYLTASVIAAGWHAPYNAAPVRDATSPVTIFEDRPRSVLLVDPPTAQRIAALRDVVREAGWTNEQPLLVLSPPWGVLEPLVLGARPVDSLLLTIYGSPGSSAAAAYHFSRLDESWRDAWILSLVPSNDRWDVAIAELQAQSSVVTGRKFPDDFVCVAENDDYRLHRPRTEASEPTRDACSSG